MPSSAPVCRAVIQGAASVVEARDTPGPRGQSRGFDVRRWSAYVLFVVAALLVALAGLAGLANREVLDGPGFVANVEHLRQDPRLPLALASRGSCRRCSTLATNPGPSSTSRLASPARPASATSNAATTNRT